MKKQGQKLSLNNSGQIEIKKGGVILTITSPLDKKRRALSNVDVELFSFLKSFHKTSKALNKRAGLKPIFTRHLNITSSNKIFLERDYYMEVIKDSRKLFTVITDDFGERVTFKGDLSADIALTLFSVSFILNKTFNSYELKGLFKDIKI